MSFNIGKKIAYYRKFEKWSQQTLAEKVGYGTRSVSDWERGRTEPNLEAIKKMARLFGITLDEFLDDD